MKDTFSLIANIITLLVFCATIIFAIANTIWKKQCEKKYKISADFFTYANKTGVLFRAAIIILLNIMILSIIYLNYRDSLYNIKTKNIKELDGFNHELIVYNKDNAVNYLYDSNKLLLKNKESPNLIYNVNFLEGNRFCLTDSNLLNKLGSSELDNINNILKLDKEFKCLKLEDNINKDEFINTILLVPNNFKRSIIIKYVYYNNLIKNIYSSSGYNIDRKDNNNLVAFKKTDINWVFKIYICLYMIVICMGIYQFYMNILKKQNAKLIDKKTNYIYIFIFALSIFVCCFLILNYNSNNYLEYNSYLLTGLIIIPSIFTLGYGAHLMTIFQKKSCVMIFCAVLGMIITFYTLSFLDILIYILFNFYLLDIIADVILQTLVVMIGLVIIVLSYANLFIDSIILDLEPKYKLIHINNKNNYFNIPEDLAIISEYKNKFLAVSYKIYNESTIVLYTNEFWFINSCDCVIREKVFKNDFVIKENDKLISRDVKKIIEASTSYIENIQYSKEPIILYKKIEKDKESNIPKKDRHGLLINQDDYKKFNFKALLSDDKNTELSDKALKEYNMCLVKKDFKLEDIDNKMLGLDTEYVLWYLRYNSKCWIRKDTVNAYFVKNGLEILINEDNENEPLPVCFKLLIVIKDNTVKAYLIEKYMDIKTVCELLNITEQDIERIENYESNKMILQIVDSEKETPNINAIEKDTNTHPTEKDQSQNNASDGDTK